MINTIEETRDVTLEWSDQVLPWRPWHKTKALRVPMIELIDALSANGGVVTETVDEVASFWVRVRPAYDYSAPAGDLSHAVVLVQVSWESAEQLTAARRAVKARIIPRPRRKAS